MPVGAGTTPAVQVLCAKHLKAAHPRLYAAWKRLEDVKALAPAPVVATAAERLSAPPVAVDEADETEREVQAGDVITPTGRLIGCTEPRIFTPPLRPLTRQTSMGFEFADFCDLVLGKPLLPWQRWLGIHALELAAGCETSDAAWRFRFKVVLVLVARQNGKSDFSRSLKLFKLYVLEMKLIIGTAQDLDIARKMLSLTNELVDEVEALSEERVSYVTANGKEALKLTGNREYVLKASNKKAGRGPSADHVDMDELREHRDWGAWGALSKTTRARRNAQLWGFSNAGDDESVVLNQLQANAQNGNARQTFLAEWSAPEKCELNDEAAICQANPALGYLFDEDSIWSDLENDPPDIFRTEVLCQRVDALDGAINLGAWRSAKDEAGNGLAEAERLVLCLDVSPEDGSVILLGGAPLPDGRTRVQVLKTWPDFSAAWGELKAFDEALQPERFGWFPGGPAAGAATDLRKLFAVKVRSDGSLLMRRGFEVVELTGSDVTEACQEFARLVASGQVVHSGDKVLDGHIAGAKKWNSGDGWRFVRKGQGNVHGAYAAAGAVRLARTLPPPRKRVKLVV